MTQRSRAGQILVWHVVSTLLISTGGFTLFAMLPLIARLRFGAGDWQTWMVTAAVPTLLLASIFWSALLRRIPLTRYLLVHWLVAMAPVGLTALAQNFWHLLLFHVIAAAGYAGWSPAYGTLLERFYGHQVRGRAYGALTAAQLVGGMLTVLAIGAWQSRDAEAFRVFLPGIAIIQGIGLTILARLATLTSPSGTGATGGQRGWTGALSPVLHMHRTLRRDRNFLRYELAFMTYGAGFMICDVLLPVLVTDKLHLDYDEFAQRAAFVQRLWMLVLALPAGWVLDRIGAARTSGIGFAVLALYPLLLSLATGANGLAGASGMYGLAMAGVMVGWMLGPVSLAPRPERVPQYVAIHATLVGFRGITFQALGMFLYRMTGSFNWPLWVAAAAFACGAVQMWLLHGRIAGPAIQRAGGTVPAVVAEKSAPARRSDGA